jgi:hypothetical protein
MNKTLTITTIALVAVVMGMSAVAPMIPQAAAAGSWPTGFTPKSVEVIGSGADHNENGLVCEKQLPNRQTIQIDDNLTEQRAGPPIRR